MSGKKGLCAVVPFKSLQHAKQRLKDHLDSEQRAQLVAAMLEDTLRAIRVTPAITRTFLVSNDPFARELAQRLEVGYRPEPVGAKGLNAVLQAVCGELAQEGYESVLIAHGDLPLLAASELQTLVESHNDMTDKAKISLVPDRVKDGSNCLICSPPAILRFSYGAGSFEKHLAIAALGNIKSTVVELTGASLDVDEPRDLQLLLEDESLHLATCTHQVITERNLQHQLV